MNKFMYFGAAILFAAFLIAGYPTSWTFSNQSNQGAYVQCDSLELEGLPDTQATTGALKLRQNRNVTYSFDEFFNDGVGLNAGTFECAVSSSRRPFEHADEILQFSSGFGEDQQFVVESGESGLTIERQESE